MKIRKAKKNEFEKILEIYLEGNIEEEILQYPKISPKKLIEEQNKDLLHTKKFMRKDFLSKNRIFLVAEENKKIIGFGEAYFEKKEGVSIGRLGRIYIKKEFRKKSVGTKIIERLIGNLRKMKIKIIESFIYTKNTPSLKLHEKLGFRKEEYKLVKWLR